MRGAMKAVFSVPELGRLAGISRWRMVRLLDANGVRVSREGRRRYVLLVDLQRAMPDLWTSIVSRDALRA